MSDFARFVPIEKTDDELRMVYGYASTPALDSQGEIVEVAALEKALPDYMMFPTIREMHQPSAVGKTVETRIESGKGMYIGAKIVDDNAWKKVKEGVYRGFSIGGRIVNKTDNNITDLMLTEISLVDRPANPKAKIDVFKVDSTTNAQVETEVSKITKISQLPSTSFALPETRELPLHDGEHVSKAMVEFLAIKFDSDQERNAVLQRIVKAASDESINIEKFLELSKLPQWQLAHIVKLSGSSFYMGNQWAADYLNSVAKGVQNMSEEITKDVGGAPKDDEVKKPKPAEVKTEDKKDEKPKVEEKPAQVEPEAPAAEEKKDEEVDLAGTPAGTQVADEPAKEAAEQPEFMKRLEALEAKVAQPVQKIESPELSKIETLELGIAKMTTLLDGLADRVQNLEKQPAAPKTVATTLVDKQFGKADDSQADPAVAAELEKVNQRIGELVSIRENNPGEYITKYADEGQKLLDQRSQLMEKL